MMRPFANRAEKNSEEGTSSPVNLTPLIDVSLVLVVILLLATPLAFELEFGLETLQVSHHDRFVCTELLDL